MTLGFTQLHTAVLPYLLFSAVKRRSYETYHSLITQSKKASVEPYFTAPYTSLWRGEYSYKNFTFMRFDIFTEVTMESNIFQNVTPSSPVEYYWRFRGTYYLYLHERRANEAINQQPALLAGHLHGLIFTLKMEAVNSAETPVNVCRAVRCAIQEVCAAYFRYRCGVYFGCGSVVALSKLQGLASQQISFVT